MERTGLLLSAGRVAALVLLLLAGFPGAGAAARAAALQPDPFAGPKAPFSLVPARFTLKGLVFDRAGKPLAGVHVRARGAGRVAISGDDGRFALAGAVAARDIVDFEAPGLASRSLLAAGLFSGRDGDVAVSMAALNNRLLVDSAGGVLWGKKLLLFVPPGAVRGKTTIDAGLLPLSQTYEDSPDPQYRRLVALRIDADVAAFSTPLTVVLRAGRRISEGTAPLLQRLDDGSGDDERDSEARLLRGAGTLQLMLPRPGTWVIVDRNRAITHARLERSFDANGDGALSSADAARVVIVGGEGAAVRWDAAIATPPGVLGVAAAGRPVAFTLGGLPVAAERKVDAEVVGLVLDSVGLGAGPPLMKAPVTVDRGPSCTYFTPWHDDWQVRAWVAHRPGPREMKAIAGAVAAAAVGDDVWLYFTLGKPVAAPFGESLFGGESLAVRKNGRRLEILRQERQHIVRQTNGLGRTGCAIGGLDRLIGGRSLADIRFFGGGRPVGESTFVTDGGGYRSLTYRGWGIVGGGDGENKSRALCSAADHGIWRVRPAVAVSGPAVSPEDRYLADTFLAARGGDIEWSAAPGDGQSRIALKPLSLVLDSRRWQPIEAVFVPRSLRLRGERDWHWQGDHAVAKADQAGNGEDGLYLRFRDGRWFEASAPSSLRREVGVAALTVPASFCAALPAPGAATGSVLGGSAIGVTGRRPAATAPIRFGRLDRGLRIAPGIIGEVMAVRVFDADGSPLVTADSLTATRDNSGLSLLPRDGLSPSRIEVDGSRQSLVFIRVERPIPPPGFFWPLAGRIAVAGGHVATTLVLPRGAVASAGDALALLVRAGGVDLQPLAATPDEVAVIGDGVPQPASGALDIRLAGARNGTIARKVPAWGYRLGFGAADDAGWFPLMISLSGLAPSRRLEIDFAANGGLPPGVVIEPRRLTIVAGKPGIARPVARLHGAGDAAPVLPSPRVRLID